MGIGEALALIVLVICISAPGIITALTDWQGNRIKRLEKELERLKRKGE